MRRDCWAQHPQEVSILKSLNYDRNIVQFYGACMRSGQELMLVTEVDFSPSPLPHPAPSPALQICAECHLSAIKGWYSFLPCSLHTF